MTATGKAPAGEAQAVPDADLPKRVAPPCCFAHKLARRGELR